MAESSYDIKMELASNPAALDYINKIKAVRPQLTQGLIALSDVVEKIYINPFTTKVMVTYKPGTTPEQKAAYLEKWQQYDGVGRDELLGRELMDVETVRVHDRESGSRDFSGGR